tara:strand:- start:1068 stop:2327 length:1260 start_codon:yes stop_codon:yes gene_type:complete
MSKKTNRLKFPEKGKSWSTIESELNSIQSNDIDWKKGRSPLYVFKGNDEANIIGEKAFMKFFHHNALGGKRVFHGIKKMEEDIIDFGLDLFNASYNSVGTITTGGSESILLAVKAAREKMRAKDNSLKDYNIIIPESAHPAFDKACCLMDIEIKRAKLLSTYKVNTKHLESLINDKTMMIVGSAPCFPHGVVDIIEDLSKIAEKYMLWLHVDACVGGYILPFFKMIGRQIPVFDFSLNGVNSISADLHKFAFCPKPISTVFFRDFEDLERSKFIFDFWGSGQFETYTLSGTRAAGAIAGAWSVINNLGKSGYIDIAKKLSIMTDKYVSGIENIQNLKMVSRPEATIINYTSETLDIYSIAEQLKKRKWLPGLTKRPKGIHNMMSMYHYPVLDDYLSDLKLSVDFVSKKRNIRSKLKAEY